MYYVGVFRNRRFLEHFLRAGTENQAPLCRRDVSSLLSTMPIDIDKTLSAMAVGRAATDRLGPEDPDEWGQASTTSRRTSDEL